jgi:transposase
MAVDRVIVTYESGGDGFWLARWLQQHGIEIYVMQPSSVPVDRRMRRAKSDRIDVDMLLRTLLAWLRGEPRVCSMVPIPDEATEDARRPMREREELVRMRVTIVNRIGAVLTVLGAGEYNPLRRDCRERLGQLRTGLDQPLPQHARAQIERLLDRLDLVRKQVAELDAARDLVIEGDAVGHAEKMIQELARLRAIGAQTATVLVHEAFVRHFRNARALGSYAGLTGTPYAPVRDRLIISDPDRQDLAPGKYQPDLHVRHSKDPLTLKAALRPREEHANVARHAPRIVNDLDRKFKTARPHRGFPILVNRSRTAR